MMQKDRLLIFMLVLITSVNLASGQFPYAPAGNQQFEAENITVSFNDFDIVRIFVGFENKKAFTGASPPSFSIHEVTGSISLENIVVYKAFDIKPVNFFSSEVEKANIEFRVNKGWVNENNIDKDSVRLYRLENLGALPTSRVDENRLAYFYIAESDGFSVFVAGAESRGTKGQRAQTDILKLPKGVEITSDAIGIVVILIGVTLLVIVAGKARKKKEVQEFRNPFLSDES